MTGRARLVVLVLVGALLAVACGGESSSNPNATGTPRRQLAPPPPLVGTPLTTPFEEGERAAGATERTNYREAPEYRLPEPGDLQEPPDSATGQEFQAPEQTPCPQDWQVLWRFTEGFRICYPEDWSKQDDGYVTGGVDDRWYSVGFALFEDGVLSGHVSVYVMNGYVRPFTYTRDCEQAYRVEFAGETAVLCPDFPGQYPEARIIAYHVRKGDLDYYVNVVPRFQYDMDTKSYLDTTSEEAETVGIQIAQTFQFVKLITP